MPAVSRKRPSSDSDAILPVYRAARSFLILNSTVCLNCLYRPSVGWEPLTSSQIDQIADYLYSAQWRSQKLCVGEQARAPPLPFLPPLPSPPSLSLPSPPDPSPPSPSLEVDPLKSSYTFKVVDNFPPNVVRSFSECLTAHLKLSTSPNTTTLLSDNYVK